MFALSGSVRPSVSADARELPAGAGVRIYYIYVGMCVLKRPSLMLMPTRRPPGRVWTSHRRGHEKKRTLQCGGIGRPAEISDRFFGDRPLIISSHASTHTTTTSAHQQGSATGEQDTRNTAAPGPLGSTAVLLFLSVFRLESLQRAADTYTARWRGNPHTGQEGTKSSKAVK